MLAHLCRPARAPDGEAEGAVQPQRRVHQAGDAHPAGEPVGAVADDERAARSDLGEGGIERRRVAGGCRWVVWAACPVVDRPFPRMKLSRGSRGRRAGGAGVEDDED